MAAMLLDLEDCVITDSGEVAFKFDQLVKQLNSGFPIGNLKALRHSDVELYNRRNPSRAIPIIDIDDTITGLPDSVFEWQLPDQYRELDIDEYLGNRLFDQIPEAPSVYVERLITELDIMRERNMEDFLRVLIYMVEVFEANNVVHGVGRGSSCASLVLYLIGVHMVDPICYDIPITEFLR